MSDNLTSRVAVWESDLRQKIAEPLIGQQSELEKILLYIDKENDPEKIAQLLEKLKSGRDLVKDQKIRIDQCQQKLESSITLLQNKLSSSSQNALQDISTDRRSSTIRRNPSSRQAVDSGIGSSVASLRISGLDRTSNDYEPGGEDDSSSSRSSYCSVPEDNPSNDLSKPSEVKITNAPEARGELNLTPTVFMGTQTEDGVDQVLESCSDNETISEDQGLRESVFMSQLDPDEKQFLENKPKLRNTRNKAPTL